MNAGRERAGMAPLEAWTHSLASERSESRDRRAVAMPPAENAQSQSERRHSRHENRCGVRWTIMIGTLGDTLGASDADTVPMTRLRCC